MNTHLLALQLMAVQGLLGAFDTLYHHELTEALATRTSARKELAIHACRALIYAGLFIGLSCWAWHGVWAIVLLLVFAVEIVLTLWDFVTEDKTRLLPATERVTHTILAMNGGAFVALLVLNTPDWYAQSTALVWQPEGYLSLFLALCGVGVGVSGVRDALAARKLSKLASVAQAAAPLRFGSQSERVLVTGATGFIGQLLVRALLADGQQVTIFVRNAKAAAWQFDGRARCVTDLAQLSPQEQFDVVINLAGAPILGPRWSSVRQAALRASRIGLTNALYAWFAQAHHQPRLFINASAIGYYGIQPIGDNQELQESSPTQEIFMSQLCRDWESSAQQMVKLGVPVVAIRLGVVFGRQGALPKMLLPIFFGAGGPLASGQQWLSWIHVDDVLRGIAFLWQKQELTAGFHAYNFTAPDSVQQRQFAKTAASVLHRPCFMPTPGWPMRLLLGEQADLLLEGQRVKPQRLLAEGFHFQYGELRAALQSLR
ncbi:MAG: TIGR01777 family protein [Burkholderiales bacterium]|nr:TIGR01777 family protein [Burkholderiales bacterium]